MKPTSPGWNLYDITDRAICRLLAPGLERLTHRLLVISASLDGQARTLGFGPGSSGGTWQSGRPWPNVSEQPKATRLPTIAKLASTCLILMVPAVGAAPTSEDFQSSVITGSTKPGILVFYLYCVCSNGVSVPCNAVTAMDNPGMAGSLDTACNRSPLIDARIEGRSALSKSFVICAYLFLCSPVKLSERILTRIHSMVPAAGNAPASRVLMRDGGSLDQTGLARTCSNRPARSERASWRILSPCVLGVIYGFCPRQNNGFTDHRVL